MLASLVEGDPVGAVAGFLGNGVDLMDLAVGVAPPGVVPAGAHVHVQGILRAELLQQVNKLFVAHLVAAIDDAQAAVLLAQGAVLVHTLAPQGTDALAIIYNDSLAKAHASGLGHTVEQFAIVAIDKLPSRIAKPGESAAVVQALGTLVTLAATHVVAIDVAVGKLVE